MSEIIELVYASRATFTPVGGGGIEPEVARILAQSRRNNPRRDVGGVLCYRDGFFFQCLEGAPAEVDAVYRRIAADPRHCDLKVLSRRPVAERRFKTWSMKYLAVDDAIRGLPQAGGSKAFNPYTFGNQTIRQLVSLLHAGREPAAVAERPPAAVLESRPAAQRLAIAALGLSATALALASFALYRGLA